MKKLTVLLVFALLISSTVIGQNKNEKLEIKSAEVKGVTYNIDIVLPIGYDSTKKYPIIYMADWWFASHLAKSLMPILMYNIKPIIIVGIQDKSTITPNDWNRNRSRDLTPTNEKTSDKLSGLPAGTSGGAKHFLAFIKKELIPTVEKKYASDTEQRGYFGYSLGGLFGTYIILNEPQLFNKYLIGSPSLWWDDYLLSKELKKIKAESLASIKSIFLAVEEEGTQLQSFSQMREQILNKKLKNLKLESVIISGESHMTAIPSAMIKGLKYLYGK